MRLMVSSLNKVALTPWHITRRKAVVGELKKYFFTTQMAKSSAYYALYERILIFWPKFQKGQ